MPVSMRADARERRRTLRPASLYFEKGGGPVEKREALEQDAHKAKQETLAQDAPKEKASR